MYICIVLGIPALWGDCPVRGTVTEAVNAVGAERWDKIYIEGSESSTITNAALDQAGEKGGRVVFVFRSSNTFNRRGSVVDYKFPIVSVVSLRENDPVKTLHCF